MNIYVDCDTTYLHIYRYFNTITVSHTDETESTTEVCIYFKKEIHMRNNLPSECIKNIIKHITAKNIEEFVFVKKPTIDKTAEKVVNYLIEILQSNYIKKFDAKYLKDIINTKKLEMTKAKFYMSNIEKRNISLENTIEKMKIDLENRIKRIRKNHNKIKNSYIKKLKTLPKIIERAKTRLENIVPI